MDFKEYVHYTESILNKTGQKHAWNQTEANCHAIAKHLAEKYGYVMPSIP